MKLRRAGALALATALLAAACAAPIVPQRTLPGGSARWGLGLAIPIALDWAPDAALCRLSGAGIGSDGWLPDQGGTWEFTFWSATHEPLLVIGVDSQGKTSSKPLAQSPLRGHTLPADWQDSPKVWAATGPHQASEPLHTFDAELALDAEPQRYPARIVWRVRLWRQVGGYETHVLTPEGVWLTSY